MLQALGQGREFQGPPDVFDMAEAPASELFVDPWACSISPLDWRLLQQVSV